MGILGFTAPDTDPEAGEFCQVAAGWYRAKTVKAEISADGHLRLTWFVLSPPWEGALVVDKYHPIPSMVMRQEDMKKAVDKWWLLVTRLGLASKSDKGKSLDFTPDQFVGIERVIEVVRTRSKKNPNDARLFSNINFDGYYAFDRPEIPVPDRIRLGLPLLPGQVLPPPPLPGSTPAAPCLDHGGADVFTAPPLPAFDPAEVV